MLQQALLGRRPLHDGTARRQRPEHRDEAAIGIDRLGARPDDAAVDHVDQWGVDQFAQGLAGDAQRIEVQQVAQLKYRKSHPEKKEVESDKERYASLRAYCQMQGPSRDECLEDAKKRFHRT